MNALYRPTAFGRSIEPLTTQQILFSFQGRIPRRTWWVYGVFGLLMANVVATVALRVAGLGPAAAESLVNLLLLWPALAVSVKRWHDRDKSGWWLFINLLPVIGTLWTLVENGLLRGTRGVNRFGPDTALTR